MNTKSMRVSAATFLVLAAGVLGAGCSKKAEAPAPEAAAGSQPAAATTPAPAPAAAAPAAAPAQPAAAPAAAATLGSAQFSGDPDLRCDLLEVKRVSGGAVRVQWRIVNTGAKKIYYDFHWEDLYTIDPAENKKYGFLTDSDGNRILEVFWGTLDGGQQRTNWAKFPAPPPTSTKIAVYIPKFTPFEDVPVAP